MSVCVIAPQEIEMELTGLFAIERVGDESKRCGLLGSPRTLQYKVLIISSPSHLNEQGFIIDWQEIKAYFAEAYRELDVFPSCEMIACQACTHIVEMLGARCTSIEVTIGSGKRAAGMKARWTREPQPI